MTRWEGPTGGGYFVNPDNPNQVADMARTFGESQDHAQNVWGWIVGYVAQALADTPFPYVALEHTGGGVMCLYARPSNLLFDENSPYLVAGPMDVDPEPEWSHVEESAAWFPYWDADTPNNWPITEEPLDADDLPGYAKKLVAAFMLCIKDSEDHQ